MPGMNAHTGKALGGVGHLRQSIADILATPVGSRVMRREYGSRLFDLIDEPLTSATLVDLYAATAEALARWEPRFQLTRVTLASRASKDGELSLNLQGQYLIDGRTVRLEGIVIA